MNRLQLELQRLYLAQPRPAAETDGPSSAISDAPSTVRALVMELIGPPRWEHLSPVWRGVQSELELPAPAIAVSGSDGLQLWFSLAEPIAATQALAFLELLRARFLPDVDPRRIRLLPGADTSTQHPTQQPTQHARLVPALHEPTGNWSAFVAADLAPIFADTPWLDIPPNEEGQATLLRALESITPAWFEEALARLGPQAAGASARLVPLARLAPLAPPLQAAHVAAEEPKQFLLRIMNDDSVSLALRIEAAKALLQHSSQHRPQHVE